MNLDQEIETAVAMLMAGGDPVGVLKEFAGRVATVTRIEERKICCGCGAADTLCFMCKAKEVVGEQAMASMPLLLAQLPALGKQVLDEFKKRRVEKAAPGSDKPSS